MLFLTFKHILHGELIEYTDETYRERVDRLFKEDMLASLRLTIIPMLPYISTKGINKESWVIRSLILRIKIYIGLFWVTLIAFSMLALFA